MQLFVELVVPKNCVRAIWVCSENVFEPAWPPTFSTSVSSSSGHFKQRMAGLLLSQSYCDRVHGHTNALSLMNLTGRYAKGPMSTFFIGSENTIVGPLIW